MVNTMTTENEKDERVGYRHPPVATRFKPGHSGNPSGRPKMVRSMKDELLDELSEPVRIKSDSGELEVTKGRAILKTLVHAAIGGNMRALSVLLSFCSRNPGDSTETQDQLAATEDTKILDDYIDRELRRRINAGNANVDKSQTNPLTQGQKP
jgi:hypothetical protein